MNNKKEEFYGSDPNQKVIVSDSGDYDLEFQSKDFDGYSLVSYQKEYQRITLMIDFADKDVYPNFTLEEAKKLRSALDWCIKHVQEPIDYYNMDNKIISQEEAFRLNPKLQIRTRMDRKDEL